MATDLVLRNHAEQSGSRARGELKYTVCGHVYASELSPSTRPGEQEYVEGYETGTDRAIVYPTPTPSRPSDRVRHHGADLL